MSLDCRDRMDLMPGEYGRRGDSGALGEPMKPLLGAGSSGGYADERSCRESMALATDVRGA